MFFKFKDSESLLEYGSKLLRSIITTERVQIIVYDKIQLNYIKILDGIKSREKHLNRGLIGLAVKHQKVLFCIKPTNDVDYNSKYDIETTLPILTIPMIDKDFLLGVIQVNN